MKLLTIGFCLLTSMASGAADFATLTAKEDLETYLNEPHSPERKAAIEQHRRQIESAAGKYLHVAAVKEVLTKADGTFVTANLTPQSLNEAFGGEWAVFETLVAVDLSQSGMSVKKKREVDPFDAAFFEHLGHLSDLTAIRVLHTKPDDAAVAPLGKLTGLKKLEFINTGMTDAGLIHFAPLKNLERFAYIGTQTTGEPFAAFKGWDQLVSSSFRGSKINDAGLKALCEAFPNYETLSLAHAKFTDAGAVHLEKLTKLKGLEIGSPNATTACLAHLQELPLEYLQLGDGLDTSAGVAAIRGIPTLTRLTLTKAPGIGVEDIKAISKMKSLQQLEIGNLELSPEQIEALGELRHLESLRLVRYSDPYGEVIQNKVAEALPGVELSFR